MAETLSLAMSDGADWSIAIGASDYLGLGGVTALSPISQGTWNKTIEKTDATMSTPSGSGQNCRYVSTTQVSVNEGATQLLTALTEHQISLRWYYNDSAGNTTLSNGQMFTFTGTPATAPSDVTCVACEWVSPSTINKDTTAGANRAWDENYGIGGIANALQLDDQSSAANHYYYTPFSVRPDARGLNNTIVLRTEFDVS